LGLLASSSHGLQRSSTGSSGELRGDAGVAVRERDVGGLARRVANDDAHDLGAHRVEARGLGVEAGDRGRFELRDPALERRLVEDVS
jgi:hypothetical protein